MLIHSDNLKILPVAEKDKAGNYRASLQGIYVDKARNRVFATDGVCLVEMSIPEQKDEDFPDINLKGSAPDKPILIPTSVVKTLQKSLVENKNTSLPILKYAQMVKNDKGYFIGTTNLQTSQISKLTGDFESPNIDIVYPKPEDKKFTIKLNKEILQRVLEALADGDIDFDFFGDDKAVVFHTQSNGNTYKGALMPVEPDNK